MKVAKDIKPLGDRILVQPVLKEEKTESGIIIPDTAKEEKPQKGKVVAVGPGKFSEKGERIPMEVKPNDVVMFRKYSPDELEVEGETLLVLSESDVLAIIN